MKIWFDLSNSPHINMFAPLIADLKREHEVVITCRPLANTIDLLELHKLPHTVVGRHYGKALTAKLFGYPVRCWELYRFLKPQRIDVAISQSSFHSPVVAKMLGVRSIYMNDNEHALGNVPSFLAASRIMVPEFLSAQNLRRQLANPRKVVNYPGVKEGIYLWELVGRLPPRRADKPRRTIYVRPEPWTAQYYHGASHFMDELLLGLKDEAQVILLPRGKAQAEHYRDPRFAGVRIVDTALDIADIAPDCDLFIGAGGTMTREMAVLGIPTISVYQEALLDVDRFLLAQGAFLHRPQLKAPEALAYLRTMARSEPNRDLLNRGRKAYDLVRANILDNRG
jgi:predicted glycosyltransferase